MKPYEEVAWWVCMSIAMTFVVVITHNLIVDHKEMELVKILYLGIINFINLLGIIFNVYWRSKWLKKTNSN